MAMTKVDAWSSRAPKISMEDIVHQILLERPELTKSEIIASIEERKASSGNLLTEEAAARLIAAEIGVEVASNRPIPDMRISQLVPGLNNVTVSGRVLIAGKPRLFNQSGEQGSIARLLIGDSTGMINVILWNEKSEFASKVRRSQIIRINHGYVRRSRRGEKELHVGLRGEAQVAPTDIEESNLPVIRGFLEKIDSVKEGRKASVEAHVESVYPISTFQRRDETQGKVLRTMLKDRTGQLPLVIWNEKTEGLESMKKGDRLLVINARVKRNSRNDRPELHVESLSSVEILSQDDPIDIRS